MKANDFCDDINLGDIVEIKWKDSAGCPAGWQSLSDLTPSVVTAYTYGRVVAMESTSLTVAGTYAPETERTMEQAMGCVTIPTACVSTIRRITCACGQEPASEPTRPPI